MAERRCICGWEYPCECGGLPNPAEKNPPLVQEYTPEYVEAMERMYKLTIKVLTQENKELRARLNTDAAAREGSDG